MSEQTGAILKIVQDESLVTTIGIFMYDGIFEGIDLYKQPIALKNLLANIKQKFPPLYSYIKLNPAALSYPETTVQKLLVLTIFVLHDLLKKQNVTFVDLIEAVSNDYADEISNTIVQLLKLYYSK